MNNKQKGSVLVWVIIILVIIIGVGTYVYSRNGVAVSQNAIENHTDWKTYTNSRYGFSFQYPASFTAEQNDGDGSSPDIAWIRVYCTTSGSDCSGQEMDIYIGKSSRTLEPQTNARVTATLKNGDYTYAFATRNISQDTSASPIVDKGLSINANLAKQIISTVKFSK